MQTKVSEKVQDRVFAIIFKRPENSECADCSVKGPRWASLDFGILICMNCAGAHRALGPSITRVRSTKLDGWFQEHIDMMEGIGNGVANSYYEYQLTKSYSKPSASASLETLIKFVNDKYVKKLFIPSNGAVDPKTAFLAQKQALKQYYFDDQRVTSDRLQSQETKIVQSSVVLGDLLDMDQDEFTDFQQPADVIKPEVKQEDQQNFNNMSILSQNGTTSAPVSFTSFSPEKQQFQQQGSSQSLNFMNLYNQNQQVEPIPHQQAQQQQHLNKYACLQNYGRQSQPHSHSNFSQPQHSQQGQQGWPQAHQNQVSQQHSQQQIQSQPPQSNQPVNIMNLYGQGQQQQQQQQHLYSAFRQTNSAKNQ